MYKDSTGRARVYKGDQAYLVGMQIENEDEKRIEASWSMIVRNMNETVLFARSYVYSSADEYWGRGSPINTKRFNKEKELYVSVIIKSLVIHK